jgi:hypothetical protein
MAVKSIQVSIMSSGTHKFDLGLLRRQGAEDLVALLLEKAGIFEGNWRVRIDEKKTCTNFTLPITVQSFKPWCIYIRIKPGDNNTCHNCSVLLPDQSPHQYAKTLYNKFKEVLGCVNSEWKPSLERKPKVTTTEPILLEEQEVQEQVEIPFQEEVVKSTLSPKQLLRDPEQVRNVLFAVHKLSLLDSIKDQAKFMDLLRIEMAWQDASKHVTGSIIANLLRNDYVEHLMVGKKIIGYALKEKGKRLIPDFVDKPVVSFGTANIIKSLGKTGEWLVNAAKRLIAIDEEQEMCKMQLAALEEEKQSLCGKIDPETQILLQKLAQTKVE